MGKLSITQRDRANAIENKIYDPRSSEIDYVFLMMNFILIFGVILFPTFFIMFIFIVYLVGLLIFLFLNRRKGIKALFEGFLYKSNDKDEGFKKMIHICVIGVTFPFILLFILSLFLGIIYFADLVFNQGNIILGIFLLFLLLLLLSFKSLGHLVIVGLLIAGAIMTIDEYYIGYECIPGIEPSGECENVGAYTVGDPNNIIRSSASKKKVLGQFGCMSKSPYSSKSGYAKYNILICEAGNWGISIRYSCNNAHSVPIRIYLDDESEPRAEFYPKNTNNWNAFRKTDKINLGHITAGFHSITFETNGTKYGVADLDYFILSIQ